jgi:glyoxylase-like metal-dependent hydrolase (beta-lactamase superfamily II)
VPVPSYLIEHPKGRVLFDSGLNLLTQTDPEPYITSAGMQFTTFHFVPGEEISTRLESVDLAATDIDLIVNSHLHYDHCGGNALLPNADILVQEPEWSHAGSLPDDDVGYRKVDFETGQRVRRIRGEHDLFGDGSVVAIPTYGHTPGHQSLRVRTADADSCSAATPAICAIPSTTTIFPGSCTIAPQHSKLSRSFDGSKRGVLESSLVMIRNSGSPSRRRHIDWPK